MNIFISFSNKDKALLKSFVDKILKLGLQISPAEIDCTGIEASKPKTGEDFKLWIKLKIQQADIVIQLISVNYKVSEICQNEMGASWMGGARVIPILVQPIDYESVGFLHNNDQLLKIDSRQDMFKLGDELSKYMDGKVISVELFSNHIDEFLQTILETSVFSPGSIVKKDEIGFATDFSFIDCFLIPDINTYTLFLKSQPTLYDCIQVFNNQYSRKAFDYFVDLYKNLEKDLDVSKYETYEKDSANFYDLLRDCHDLPGGMTLLAKQNVIKNNIRFYSFRFKRLNEESGTSISVWCFINKRWVFFPKPWRIL